MNKQDIIGAILSKDSTRVAEAKVAIKTMLDARASQFRVDSSKFIAKSLFEAVDQSAVDHHEKMRKQHLDQAQKHAPHAKEDDVHWNAERKHNRAADEHANASAIHQKDHPRKQKATDQADKYSGKANDTSASIKS